MSVDSLRKGVYTASLDDDDSDLSLQPVGPKSLAAMREGRSLLKRDEDSLDVEEMGPKSMAALADLGPEMNDNINEDSLDLVEVGPKSMAAFAATQPTGKEVNSKLKEGGVLVPQPKPRKKPQEDKHLTDLHAENARLRGQKGALEEQLDRAKRESDARAKQQEKMIGGLTAQLEV
jgi:hypothetical protein